MPWNWVVSLKPDFFFVSDIIEIDYYYEAQTSNDDTKYEQLLETEAENTKHNDDDSENYATGDELFLCHICW